MISALKFLTTEDAEEHREEETELLPLCSSVSSVVNPLGLHSRKCFPVWFESDFSD